MNTLCSILQLNFDHLYSSSIPGITKEPNFRLGFLTNPDLEQLILEDRAEAYRCLNGENYKAATLLTGSIVEAILTAVLDKKEVACFTITDYNNFNLTYPHVEPLIEDFLVFYEQPDRCIVYGAADKSSHKAKIIKHPSRNLRTLVKADTKYINTDRLSDVDKQNIGNLAYAEIETRIQKLLPTEDLYNFVLHELVDASKAFKIILDQNIFSLIEPLRHYRNAIHPGVTLRKSIKLDEEIAKIAIQTLNLLVRHFN